MRLISLFLCLSVTLLISTIVYSQKISKNINTTSPLSKQFETYNKIQSPKNADLEGMIELMNAYSLKDEDTTVLIGEKALKWSKKLRNQQLEARVLLDFGYAYGAFGQYEKSKELILESQQRYKQLKDEKGVNIGYNKLGNLAMRQNNFEEALDYFLKLVEAWGDFESENLSVEPYLNIAWIFFNKEELGKVEQYVDEAKKAANRLGDKRSKMLVKSKEGILLMYLSGQFEVSVRENSTEKEPNDSLAIFMKRSEDAYNEALQLAKELNDTENIISILNNMVVYYIKTGQKDKILEKGKEAEQFAISYGDRDLLVQAKYNLVHILLELKQLKEAEKYGQEALSLAQEYGLKRKEAIIKEGLIEVYRAMKDYEKAFLYMEERLIYEIEVGNVERNEALAKVEAQFQTVKKEKEILELKAKNKRIARQRNYIIGSLLLLGIILFGMLQFNKIRKERNDKKAFAEALMHTQEAERKRIAQDLHDGIGQSLLLLKKQLVANQAVSLENQTMISETLDEVRAISRDLHPIQLEKFGLTAAIQEVIQKVESSTKLFVTTEINNIDHIFDSKTNIQVYRAVQEALNNIIKHAQATAARVTIETKADDIVINILDNGKGFDYELAVVKSKSLGLKTMFERLASIGGKMKITSNEPTGTRVVFKIPK